MSLATRCPACTTVFRVVQDQLKVSQGWVRCGHCQEVFNALESLFDLNATTGPPASGESGFAPTRPAFEDSIAAFAPVPPAQIRPGVAAPPAAAPTRQTSAMPTAAPSPSPSPSPVPRRSAPPVQAMDSGPRTRAGESLWLPSFSPESPAADSNQIRDFVVSRQPAAIDSMAYAAEIDSEAIADFLHGSPASDLLPAPAVPQPAFVRQAERDARWQRPWVRFGLLLCTGLLGLLLIAQAAILGRDGLAARWPDSRPALLWACEKLDCQVGSPLAIDQIVLETSHLARTEQAGVLSLSADLHNTAPYAVRAPALELSFTSESGQIQVRKVLSLADLGQAAPALEADGSWHLETRLAVGELQVAGYTLEVFYP